MSTLAELTTPMTRAEIEAAIYAAIEARGAKTTSWKSGSVVRTIIVGVSIVLAGLSALQAEIAKMGFLELASGEWLTLLARYVYNVPRNEGTFASGNVTIDNSSGFVYLLDPGDLIVRHDATGKTYRNTAIVSIGSMATGVSVPVQAVELGSDSSAAAATITEFETVFSGLSVTNASAIVGTDREEDPALRVRCLEKTGTLSPNGPRDAYSYIAKAAKNASGANLGVTRTRTVADGMGNVVLYVASASGTVSAPSLAIIQADIERLVAPLCVTPDVESAAPLTVPVTATWWIRDAAGLSESDAEDLAQTALEAMFAAHPIGGYTKPGEFSGKLFVESIEAAIVESSPGNTVDLSVSLPSGDVALGVSQVPQLGVFTLTVYLVSGGVIG